MSHTPHITLYGCHVIEQSSDMPHTTPTALLLTASEF